MSAAVAKVSKKRAAEDDEDVTAGVTAEIGHDTADAAGGAGADPTERHQTAAERRKAKKLRKKLEKGTLSAVPATAAPAALTIALSSPAAKLGFEIQQHSQNRKQSFAFIQIEVRRLP